MLTLNLAELKQKIAATQTLKGDLHQQRAAEFFCVPYEKVTSKQREIGKQLNYSETYNYRKELSECNSSSQP